MSAKTKFNDFHGMVPVQESRLQDKRFADCAIDVDLRYGDLRPFPCPVEVCDAGGLVETIYPIPQCECLTFNNRVRIIEDCGLYYQSSDDGLRISTSGDLCVDSGCNWILECPELQPGLTAVDCTDCDCETEAVSYFYTYVMKIGDKLFESHPSPATDAVISCHPTNNLLTVVPSPNTCFTGTRIYRSVTGFKSGSEDRTQVNSGWMLIAELPVGTTDFTDTVINGPLSHPLINDFGAPPADLKEIIRMDNGVIVGISGRSIYWTLPGLPMTFSNKRRRRLNEEWGNPLTLESYDNELYVLTDNRPVLYTFSITSGGLQTNLYAFKFSMPLMSLDSVSVGNQGVVFASDKGIAIWRNQQIGVISSSDFHGPEWASIDPSSVHGVIMDNAYVFSSSTNSFLLEFGDGMFTPNPRSRLVMLSFGGLFDEVTAIYHNYRDGLRFAKGDKVYMWERDSKKLGSLCDDRFPGICEEVTCCPYYWRSSVEDLERSLTYTAARIEIDKKSGSEPINFTMNSVKDGLSYVVTKKDISDGRSFRIKGGRRGADMYFEVSGCSVIKDVTLGTSRTALGE